MVARWIEKWSPLAERALAELAAVVAEAPVPFDAGAIAARIAADVSRETGTSLTI
ncbi:MAG: hypothetical protein ACRDP7_39175 [Trebonia sp.]